jgi:hypothetical protein
MYRRRALPGTAPLQRGWGTGTLTRRFSRGSNRTSLRSEANVSARRRTESRTNPPPRARCCPSRHGEGGFRGSSAPEGIPVPPPRIPAARAVRPPPIGPRRVSRSSPSGSLESSTRGRCSGPPLCSVGYRPSVSVGVAPSSRVMCSTSIWRPPRRTALVRIPHGRNPTDRYSSRAWELDTNTVKSTDSNVPRH